MYRELLKQIVREHRLIGVEAGDHQSSHSTALPAPHWVQEGPLYEVFLRNFSGQGTLAAVMDKLDHLQDLGVKTLWLMPIHPVGEQHRKGSRGSPYAVRDHLQIDRKLGTEKELKQLVSAVHQRDMRLIIDMVVNHAAVDHVWFENHPEYFLSDSQFSRQRKLKDWTDVHVFNYDQYELREQLKDVLCYWIEEFDIDGYRCDVAGMVPLDFWQDVIVELKKLKADIFMLAEWESPLLHEKTFHATYDWTSLAVLEDIYQGRRPASDCLEWLQQKTDAYPAQSLFLRFTENHDLPRTTKVFGQESFYPFVIFQFAMAGIPLIYNGQEIGLKKMPDQFNHDPLDWKEGDEKIWEFYRNLIRWRKTYSALSSDQITVIRNNQPDKVISFVKHDPQNDILVVLNFSAQELCVQADIAALDPAVETYSDLFSNRSWQRNALEKLTIKPFAYYLFRPEATGSFK